LLRGTEYLEAQRQGFLGGELRGEMPPPSALAGRPSVMMAMEGDDNTTGRKKNLAGWMWGFMGGKADREVEEGKEEGIENHGTTEASM